VNRLIKLIFFVCLVVSLMGCATAPRSVRAYPVSPRTIGVEELKRKGVNVEYNSLTRRISLSKGSQVINIVDGFSLAEVNGRMEKLNSYVELDRDGIYMPSVLIDFLNTLIQPKAFISKEGVVLLRRIVIDAGHGGKDPGAIGAKGLKEKDVNLDVAKRLKKVLEEKGLDVIMTRDTDVFLTLSRRVCIANGSRADLFVSIHANASGYRQANGFEVYYFDFEDSLPRAISSAENSTLGYDSNNFHKNASFSSKVILWDLLYTQNRLDSQALANILCQEAKRYLGVRMRGVKRARFYVIKNTRSPAVLVETGFLSNSEEERKLSYGWYRQQVAESIASGILRFGELKKGSARFARSSN